MAPVVRRAVATVVGILVFGWILSGCAGESSVPGGGVGTSGRGEELVDVEVTPGLSIAIQNRATGPLFNVSVGIRPSTGDALYTTTVPRMEPGERRNLAFGSFRRADGTTFSSVMAFVRPKEITVTAEDGGGAKHEITVPWET